MTDDEKRAAVARAMRNVADLVEQGSLSISDSWSFDYCPDHGPLLVCPTEALSPSVIDNGISPMEGPEFPLPLWSQKGRGNEDPS